MLKRVAIPFWACVAVAAGCAPNAMVTNNAMRNDQAYGDYGVVGNGNEVTLQSGSFIVKLSIIGDKNNVMVEENVPLAHLEIWGSNNTINVPEGIYFRVTQVGKNNQVIHRPLSGTYRPRNEYMSNTTTTVEIIPPAQPGISVPPPSAPAEPGITPPPAVP